MAKRTSRKAKTEPVRMTPERAGKADVVRTATGTCQVRSYGERLFARTVISRRQLEAWVRIEDLAARAEYCGRPKGARLDGVGGGGAADLAETERYVRARQQLSRLFASVGPMGTSILEFMVILGEDAETYARRVPGWNRHKIMGGLSVALDMAANSLGIGPRPHTLDGAPRGGKAGPGRPGTATRAGVIG